MSSNRALTARKDLPPEVKSPKDRVTQRAQHLEEKARDGQCSDRCRLSAPSLCSKDKSFLLLPERLSISVSSRNFLCWYTHAHTFNNGFLSVKMFPCLSKFGSETYGHSSTPCQITTLCHVLPHVSRRLGWLKNDPYTPSCPSSRRQSMGRGNEHAQVKDVIVFCSAGFISQPQLCLYCGEHLQCIPASSTFSLGLGLSSPLKQGLCTWNQSEVWESCLTLTWTNYLRASVSPITFRRHISLLHR